MFTLAEILKSYVIIKYQPFPVFLTVESVRLPFNSTF